MMKRILAAIAIASLALGCTVEVKADKPTTPTTQEHTPQDDPQAEANASEEFCRAYVAWWNTPEGSPEESAAEDTMRAAGDLVTDRALVDIVVSVAEASTTSEVESAIGRLDAYCGVTTNEGV